VFGHEEDGMREERPVLCGVLVIVMMPRSDFTCCVGDLIAWIRNQGWEPVLCMAERSREEQARLFALGKSKLDGVKKIGAHQYQDAGGRYAVDILIFGNDGKMPYVEAHKYWESIGGSPVIDWDQNHFEMDERKKQLAQAARGK
jgi:hypothetical protein